MTVPHEETHKTGPGQQAPGARGDPASRSSAPGKAVNLEAVEGAARPDNSFAGEAREHSGEAPPRDGRTAPDGAETMRQWGAQGHALALDSTGAAQSLAEYQGTFLRAFADASREWFAFGEGVMQRTAEGVGAMTNCRSVPDLVKVHNELVRETLQRLVMTTQKVAESSMRSVDEAGRKLTEAAERRGYPGSVN